MVQLAGVDRLTLASFGGVVLIGGLNGIAVKATVGELEPLWSAAVRFIAASILMLGLVTYGRRTLPRGRSLGGAALYGAVGIGAGYGFLYTALQSVPAGTAMLLIALAPLFTFGLAIAHRQEAFRFQGLVGALVALGGVGIVTADQLGSDVPAVGLLLAVLATVCLAESSVIAKWIPRSDPFGTNVVAMGAGGGLLLVGSALGAERWTVPVETDTWVALGYLALLGSVVMFALFLFTLGRWTASAVSYVTLLMPMVTIVAAAILTAERPSVAFLLGGAVVLVGVYVGAFLHWPARTSASSAPECLPIDACADAAAPVPAPAAPGDRSPG
ncbi:MAG TPA: EamA family transporter [Candidatus Binatia bacterium]|nr:EamA family transporter [Candidatus Binatia bacterium]